LEIREAKMKKQRKLILKLETEIAGVHCYKNDILPGELTRFRREPDNFIDENAIEILKKDKKKVGYVRRQLASVIAPYVDKYGIRLRCDVTGQGDGYFTPILLKIYQPKDESQWLSDKKAKKLKRALLH
jgi:hypothetical protein